MLTVARYAALGTVVFSAVIMCMWRDVPKVDKVPPGLVLQVSNSPSQIYDVLGKPSDTNLAATREIAVRAQYVDYALIPCYVLLFVAIGGLQFGALPAPWRWQGVLCAILALAAGVCDYREDFGILAGVAALNRGQPPDPSLAAMWSWPKWSLLFVILIMQAWVLISPETSRLPPRSPFMQRTGLVLMVATVELALFGLAGCVRQDRQILSLGADSLGPIPLWFAIVGGVELVQRYRRRRASP